MVWDLAGYGSDRDGTKVSDHSCPSEQTTTDMPFELDPTNGQWQTRTVQDLGTYPSQGRQLCQTAIVILQASAEVFQPHPYV